MDETSATWVQGLQNPECYLHSVDQVKLVEKRPDLRKVEQDAGRSINLAFSDRGVRALQMVGLENEVEELCLPMLGRMIHDNQGNTFMSPYSGKKDKYINSISRPGLNMLLNEFKGYYMFGVGVSWNAFDWKNTTRQKQVLQLQQEMIQSQEATFIQNIQLLLVQQKEQISKIETMLGNDQKMVALRTDITKAAASKLENESITASDYIQELQAETIAKLNYELRKIQLNEAQEKYNLIKGKN